MDLVIVFIAALVTALATGLGALPLLALKDASQRMLGAANAAAGGLMLAATQLLIVEGVDESAPRTLAGAVIGVVVIWIIAHVMHAGHEHDVTELAGGASMRTAVLIVAVMTAHSAAEGIGVGVSFGGGEQLGLLVTLAIAVHNIPEGLAISLALVPAGTTIRAAAGWSIFSSLPQPLLAIPAYLFVEEFRTALPIGLGLAAGAMIWMVLFELLPEALDRAGKRDVALGLIAGYAV
ncbi:MAG: ZIP family metal transporter, partial [Thermoleophilia bacterium]|nr:ZIP family metal transporter [Thermoleophilia bacterium]